MYDLDAIIQNLREGRDLAWSMHELSDPIDCEDPPGPGQLGVYADSGALVHLLSNVIYQLEGEDDEEE